VIWLQTPTVFWLGGETISLCSSMSMGLIMLGRQMHIRTTEPLMPEPSVSDCKMAIKKLNRHRSPGIYLIPAELIKAGGRANP
jgi:hypothetical protein